MLKSIVRDALLTSVMCERAAGQLPQEPAIDGAERQFPGFRFCARAGDVVENPGDFAAGKIRVDDEARPLRG